MRLRTPRVFSGAGPRPAQTGESCIATGQVGDLPHHRRLLVVAACALCACISPRDSGVKVIVGAKLEAAPGRAPIDYSVVVIADGKFQAVGPQATTPVPKGAEITRGLGSTIEPLPGGEPIESGRPADLVLKGAAQRVMRHGEWVQ